MSSAIPALRADPRPAPAVTFDVRSMALEEIDERLAEEWRALEARALEGNAYLSPDFLLPVVRHLEPAARLRVLAVRASGGGARRLVGLGIFREMPPSRRFPLPHLRAYQNPHSYLSGILVDAELAEPALDAFFRFVTRRGAPWHGVAFSDWRCDGPLGEAMLRATERAGVRWHLDETYQRAALVPARLDARSFDLAFEAYNGRDWRKKTRRLLEAGELTWRVLTGAQCDAAAIERFLALEDRRWTRAGGSSLKAAGQEELFREICRGFSRGGRLLISELLFRGEVIASTSNFVSGDALFAFKLGWSDAHARMRPGILNDLMFLRAHGALAHLSHVDSGSQPGSHMEELWGDRVTLQSGVFSTSALGHATATTCDALRKVKRAVARVARAARPW